MNLNDFKLDKFNIEDSALKQASLYQYYASLVADKQKEIDKANLQLEQMEATKKIEIRASGTKFTQDQVDCVIATDSNIISKKEQIIELKHDLATLKTAVSALEQKRDMIQVESRMQNNAVFQQSNNVGDHSSAEWAERVLNKQLREKM